MPPGTSNKKKKKKNKSHRNQDVRGEPPAGNNPTSVTHSSSKPTPPQEPPPDPSPPTRRAKKRQKTSAKESGDHSETVKGSITETTAGSERSTSTESDSITRVYSGASTSTVPATVSSDGSEAKEPSLTENELTAETASETEPDGEVWSTMSERSDGRPVSASKCTQRRGGKRRMSFTVPPDCNPTEHRSLIDGVDALTKVYRDNRLVIDGRLVPVVKQHRHGDKDKGKGKGHMSDSSAEGGYHQDETRIDVEQPNATREHSPKNMENSRLLAELELLKKELDHKNDMIFEMQKSSKKLRAGLSCLICLELMANPFTVSCGHTTCYECLTDWLKQKGECPICRVPIEKPPVLSFSMRDLAENVLDGMNSDEKAVQKQKMVEKIALLRGITDYFPGRFSGAVTIIDEEDEGTRRCSRCTWEVVGNVCTGCGEVFPDLPSDDEFANYNDDDMYGEELDDNVSYDSDFVVDDDAIEYDHDADDLEGYDDEMGAAYMEIFGFDDGLEEFDDEEGRFSDSNSDPGNFGPDLACGVPPYYSSDDAYFSGMTDRGERSPTYSPANDSGGGQFPSSDYGRSTVTDEESEELSDHTELGHCSGTDEYDDGIREAENDDEGDMIANGIRRRTTIESDGIDYPEEAGSEPGSDNEEDGNVIPATRKRRRIVTSDSDKDSDNSDDGEEEDE